MPLLIALPSCLQPLVIEEFGKNVSDPLDESVIAKERNPVFK